MVLFLLSFGGKCLILHLENLPDVVGGHGFAVDKAGGGPLDNLEAKVGAGHELEYHVEHALAATEHGAV